MKNVRRLAAGACLLATGAASLRAQAAPATIPVPLALVLFGMEYMDPATLQLSVGAPPAGWPAELQPPGVPVAGGVRMNGGLTSVFDDTARTALASYQRLLESRGFVRHVSNEGGFQSGGGPGDFYCRDSVLVAPSMTRSGQRRMLRVSYSISSRDSRYGCGAAPQRAESRPALVIPKLTAPPGAQSRGGSSGSGSSGTEANDLVIDSTRVASAVIAHYVAQLAAAGWTISPPVADPLVGAAALDAKDSTGTDWHGLITVRSSGSRHRVSIVMKPGDR